MENIYTEEYLEKRHTRFLKSKDDSVAAAQHKTFLEGLNTRLRLGEVIGFFDPKPQGPKSAEMWEKYMVQRSSL